MKYGTDLSLDPDWGEISQTPIYAGNLEDWGYDYIWIPDEGYRRNVYSLLTLASMNTDAVRLGVAVTNPYTRHPLITGGAIATVNEASGGRAVLGLGAGASTLFERQGIKRPHPPLTAIREAVEVLHPFLRGEVTGFEGITHTIRNASMDFQSRDIPIYIAARGPKLLQLAGEIADGVIIGSLVSREGLEYAYGNIRKGLERGGRTLDDLEVVLWGYTSISEDEERARRLVENLVVSSMWSSRGILPELGIGEEWRSIESGMKRKFGRGIPASQIYPSAASELSPEAINSWALAGSMDKVKGRIEGYERREIDQFAMLTLAEGRNERMEMQRRFSEDIIQACRD
jgi:5,10-methylenetetrahydromethanopterin reductase